MKLTIVLTTMAALVFAIIICRLWFRIRFLQKKLKYVDEAGKWHKLAVTDVLTGIYNRNAYDLRIAAIKDNAQKENRGILLFDIDDFKLFNDVNGHLTGDAVLKKVANILLDIFPEPGYRVFRIGGDEFAVISENVSEYEIIQALLHLKKSFEANENVRVSKGYAMIKGNLDEAFREADEMLYADKLSRKSKDI